MELQLWQRGVRMHGDPGAYETEPGRLFGLGLDQALSREDGGEQIDVFDVVW